MTNDERAKRETPSVLVIGLSSVARDL